MKNLSVEYNIGLMKQNDGEACKAGLEEIREGKVQVLPNGLVMVTEGGREVKNPPANAGDTGLITGSRKIPLALGQLCRAIQLLRLHAQSLCSATRETTKMRSLCTTIRG